MQHVIPTRRTRMPGALWVGVALMALAVVVVLSSYNREHQVQARAWAQGYDAAQAELVGTVADAYRAGLAEGVMQATACEQAAPAGVLRAGCYGARP